MSIPLPFMRADGPDVGLGELMTYVIHTLFGGTPCPPCQARATKLNTWVRFRSY